MSVWTMQLYPNLAVTILRFKMDLHEEKKCTMSGFIPTGYLDADRPVVLVFYYLGGKMTVRIFHVSGLDSISILIGAWQVMQNGDGFEVVHWKFLTDTVEGNVKPCAGVQSSKIICQNLAHPRRKLPVIFDVHLIVHKGGFDQEPCCTLIKLIFG